MYVTGFVLSMYEYVIVENIKPFYELVEQFKPNRTKRNIIITATGII